VTSYPSIAPRTPGVILFIAIAGLLWMLDTSLRSESGLEQVKACFANPIAKPVLWGVLSALLYHLVAGIRHLLMDAGIGEGLESGRLGAQVLIVVAAVLIVLLGVWIW